MDKISVKEARQPAAVGRSIPAAARRGGRRRRFGGPWDHVPRREDA